ncbi:MAG: hypothetical protein A3G81_09595 [Betaproteobacteria bacterium RIFCSPLOWO2_12_FULL_65_14]|nr:MAG: hypothetical protein A3G81_09595 [Betaproteobacteria bacterium RIFCSPLOWO2_12_FULL_65_14]
MKNIELLDASATAHDLVVVAFDMCSSSNVIEDLSRTGNLVAFDRLLKNLHVWLWSNAKQSGYVLYKFTGDGWIVFFPASAIDGNGLMRFLLRLSRKYKSYRESFVDKHLESMPKATGLTFGVEMGTLRKVVLGRDLEFAGRALNIACRLQAAVKDKGPDPDYRCLFSRKVFNSYLREVREFKFFEVERSLRNISGGERYRCVKANLAKHVRT